MPAHVYHCVLRASTWQKRFLFHKELRLVGHQWLTFRHHSTGFGGAACGGGLTADLLHLNAWLAHPHGRDLFCSLKEMITNYQESTCRLPMAKPSPSPRYWQLMVNMSRARAAAACLLCVGPAQVCKAFPRRGHKNDDFLHKDVHSASGL